MRLIYLAGPYSHKNEKIKELRVKSFHSVLAFFANTTENLCLYSPIVHWHQVATTHKLETNFNTWMAQDFHMIKKSTAVWVYPMVGWKESYGLTQELEYARDIERDIFYIVRSANGDFHITDVEPTDA